MQNIPNTTAEFREKEQKEQFRQEGIPILDCCLRWPVVLYAGAQRSAAAISNYYSDFSAGYLRFLKNKAAPAARRAYVAAAREGRSVPPALAEQRVEITYNRGYVSGYIEQREEGPQGVERIRYGDTFELSTGRIVRLSELFEPGARWKRALIGEVQRRIETDRGLGACYRENAERLAKRRFRAEQFYLTERGVALFYAAGTLMPRAHGVTVFVIPYSRLTSVLRYDLAPPKQESV